MMGLGLNNLLGIFYSENIFFVGEVLKVTNFNRHFF